MGAKTSAWLRFFLAYFVDAFLRSFTRHLPLVGILAFLAALLGGLFACELGAPLLVWHEDPWRQLVAGFSIGLLLSIIFFVAFLLDYARPGRKWQRSIPSLPPGRRELEPLDEARYFLAGAAAVMVVLAAIIGVSRALLVTSGSQCLGGLAWYRYLYLPMGAIAAGILVAWATQALARWSRRASAPHYVDVANARMQGFELIAREADLQPRRPRREPWWERLLLLGVPDKDRAGRRLHFIAALLFLLLLVAFVAIPLLAPNYAASPVSAAANLLALVAAVYGAVRYRVPNASLLICAVLLLFWLGGRETYKVRVPGFTEQDYGSPVVLTCPQSAPDGLVRIEQTPWSPGRRSPLVIICASGGGIRAMTWTGAVLCELESRMAGFPYHTRLITGASGGMVGAAYYVQTLQPPMWNTPEPHFHHDVDRGEHKSARDAMLHNLGEDALSELIKHGVFKDVPAAFSPITAHDRIDRGRALEITWARHLGGDFGTCTLGSLAAGERSGWRPSLVFSPMMVEDGRRLLISNLDLDFMTVSRGPLLGHVGTEVAAAPLQQQAAIAPAAASATPQADYSRSAFEFSRLFPARWSGFPLITAARLSASFPYFSPAVQIPTNPRRRVVDAGYFDNYGITVASAWLDHLLSGAQGKAWLREHVSGVVVVQIRDGVSRLSGDGCHPGGSSGALSRGFEWMTSPVEGALAARDSVSLFRNDVQLERLRKRFLEHAVTLLPPDVPADAAEDYFTVVTFDNPHNVSLSWYLTRQEFGDLLQAAQNHRNTSSLLDWWERHGGQGTNVDAVTSD